MQRDEYKPAMADLYANCLNHKPPLDPNPIIADWARNDLFFLLVYVLKRKDADNDWVLARCREVQAEPDGRLDLWARGHYKSTIITFALTIQDILRDPETTVGIFSHTRPIAKAFLRQIKREFETNDGLKDLFPDILYADPANQSPKWSEDEGITVKRASNPKEATIEAWGLVDGQPTSKHFKRLIYDDVVTRESVSTPEMMAKTTEAMQLSFNLAAGQARRRFIGTRYHFNDSYRTIMEAGTAVARLYPATVDGKVEGDPVFFDRKTLADKRRDMGPYVFGAQMLQDPTADEKQGFKMEWLRMAAVSQRGQNLAILVDPSSGKKMGEGRGGGRAQGKGSDYTAMWCVGLGPDKKIYVHDMLRDRLSLTERAEILLAWHRKWQPMAVGYEEYGMQADIEHIQSEMERANYRFDITALGGATAKNDRIRRLIPWFEQGRIFLPPSMPKTNYEGRSVDLVSAFKNEEYLPFPVGQHDDMLDALARVLDPDLPMAWPAAYIGDDDDEEPDTAAQGRNATTGY